MSKIVRAVAFDSPGQRLRQFHDIPREADAGRGPGMRIVVQQALVVPAARSEQWRSVPVFDRQQVNGKGGTS